MKRYFIFILVNLITFFTFSQDKNSSIKFGLTAGYADFSVGNLESINEEIMAQLPFETNVIDNFPSRFYYGGHILLRLANWYSIGPAYEFHSTGSRIGAKDYSGLYQFDQILSTHQLEIENEFQVSGGFKPAVFIDINGGVNFSSWKMKELLNVGEEKQEDKNEYAAMKPFVYPAMKIAYPVYKDFSAFAKVGYLFDLGGKYHLSDNKDYQSTLKVPWSGIRFSLGLQFEID